MKMIVEIDRSGWVSDETVNKLNGILRKGRDDDGHLPRWQDVWHAFSLGHVCHLPGLGALFVDHETNRFIASAEDEESDLAQSWIANHADWEVGEVEIGDDRYPTDAQDVFALTYIEARRECDFKRALALLVGEHIRRDWQPLSWQDVQVLGDLPYEQAEEIRAIYDAETMSA